LKSRTIFLILASVIGVSAAGVAVWLVVSSRVEEGETVLGLVGRLRVGPESQREAAAASLGQVVGPGSVDAARALIEALDDRVPEIRARSARSLASVLTLNPSATSAVAEASANALKEALNDREPRVCTSAALGLSLLDLDPPGTFEALIGGLRHGDQSLRAEARAALSARLVRDAEAPRRLVLMLGDADPDVRELARSVLSRSDEGVAPASAIPLLATALRIGSPSTRAASATILGRSTERSPAARDLLQAVLRTDADPTVRTASAESLATYAEEAPARAALRAATEDPDLRVRASAWISLAAGRQAARAEALAELEAALVIETPRRNLAVLAFSPLTTRAEALARLKSVLAANPQAPSPAIDVESDPARAVVRLIEALRDSRPRVRAASARVLGELPPATDPRPVVDALALALADREPSVRRASATALARFGPAAAGASEALRQALNDADLGVNAAAHVAIRGINQEVKLR
jgi:HEAT repeat protein